LQKLSSPAFNKLNRAGATHTFPANPICFSIAESEQDFTNCDEQLCVMPFKQTHENNNEIYLSRVRGACARLLRGFAHSASS
jgi:hypothetical protein